MEVREIHKETIREVFDQKELQKVSSTSHWATCINSVGRVSSFSSKGDELNPSCC